MREPLPLFKRLRYGAESMLFFPFMGFFKLVGIDAASAIGGFIGRHVFYRLPVTNRARQNLRAAYPGMPRAEIEVIVREMCDNLGRVTAEYPHLGKLYIDGPERRVELVGTEHLDAAMAAGKGMMVVSGHFANWETMTAAAGQRGCKGLVYRPPNNPTVAEWISRQRGKLGPKEQIGKGVHGTRRIVSLLRQGQAIAMLVDQKTGEGIAVPFFGRPAMTTHLPATFALKFGAALLPVRAERIGGARFRVIIQPPIQFTSSGDSERDVVALTAKINETIEEFVRVRPSQWLWIHRRWTTPRDIAKLEKKKAQALGGKTVGVEREGSSLS
jgi:KDO2-lipid IV(A) lauroyltransferase